VISALRIAGLVPMVMVFMSVVACAGDDTNKAKPGPFSIDYDASQIDSRMTYALRATIRVDGKMMFTTMDYTDPFSGNPVEVLVKRVPGG